MIYFDNQKKWFLIFLLLPFCIFASNFSASVELSSKKVRLDDQLFITLTLNYPSNYESDSQKMAAKLLSSQMLVEAPFAFVTVKQKEKTQEGKMLKEVIEFELDPQVVGMHPLTFYEIPFSSEENVVELISPVFFVEVITNPVDASFRSFASGPLEFDPGYPIEPNIENRSRFLDRKIEELSFENREAFAQRQIPWFAFSVICLVAFLGFVIRKNPIKESDVHRLKRLRKQTFKNIESLRGKRFKEKEEYYKELSDLVRLYFEQYYGIEAPCQTTKEFLESLAKQPILKEETKKSLKDFLIKADLVKFATYVPTKDECAYAENLATKVIHSK